MDSLERRQSLSEKQELVVLGKISYQMCVGQVHWCSLYHPWFQHQGAYVQDEGISLYAFSKSTYGIPRLEYRK